MKNFLDKYFVLLLVLIVAGASILRLWGFEKTHFLNDYDQFFTATTVSGFYEKKIPHLPIVEISDIQSSSFSDVLTDANRDYGNSFSYNILLHYWGKVFGFTDSAYRLFSCVFDVLSILLIVSIGRLLKISRQRIVIAIVLFAVFPLFVQFAAAIRTYAFTTTVTLLLVRSIIIAEQKESSSWAVVSIALWAVLLFLGHYLTYYVLLTIVVYYLIYWKKNPKNSVRVLLGFIVAGVVCASFLLFNYNELNKLNKRSESYKDIANSGEEIEGARKLDKMTVGNFMPKVISYLNAYYIGSRIAPTLARNIFGDVASLVVGLLLLLIPIIFILNIYSPPLNKGWVLLFIGLFVTGNLSAIVLSLVSGHMTPLSSKYTIFSIPFFIMAATFFTKKNRLTIAAFAVVFFFCGLMHLYGLGMRGMKPILVSVGESSRDKYLGKEIPQLTAMLTEELKYQNSDTVFVATADDLVFIKTLLPDFNYRYAYIMKYDSTREHELRIAKVNFTVPD